MRTLKAIIFDLDGTLAETEEQHRRAFNKAFQEFSLLFHWSVSDYRRLLAISGGQERIFSFLQAQCFAPPAGQSLRVYTARLHRCKSALYRETIALSGIQLRSGVKRLIAEAKARQLSLAIATSTALANVNLVLKHAYGDQGAAALFDVIASCDLVVDKKPAPTVYQYVLAHLGALPEQCVAIEDTRNGNCAALSAGIKTVITIHPLTIDEDFTGASLVVDQLGEPDDHCQCLQGQTTARYVNVDCLAEIVGADTNEWAEAPHKTAVN